MRLYKRFIAWLNTDEHAFDAEYDRMHSEINENPSILIDAIRINND